MLLKFLKIQKNQISKVWYHSLVINEQLPPENMFKYLFRAIHCYTDGRKVEEASRLVDLVQTQYSGKNVTAIRQSDLLSDQLKELRIYRSILNVMTFKTKSEALQFTYANLNQNYSQYFEAIIDATLNTELNVLYVLIHGTNNLNLSEGHVALLHKHYAFVSETIEAKLLKE